jgi:esterase
MKLFYRELGAGRPLIILHGLFGMSDNWISIAKVLGESYKVYLLDQRNHGQSPWDDEFNYGVMANDLKEFIETHNIENPIIIGHSMGGKVSMEFAVNNPDSWSKLVIVDITPRVYPVHHDKILGGLNALDLNKIKSRDEADQQLSNWIPVLGIRQFLLKNLTRGANGFEWKINIPVIAKNIETIGSALSKPLSVVKPVLFVKGKNSDYIMESDEELIKKMFPGAQLETIDNAGHWVHAEQPDKFLETVQNFLER